MDNVRRIVDSGMCTGCSACDICENISFSNGPQGFPVPMVHENCIGCGRCLTMCICDPERDD